MRTNHYENDARCRDRIRPQPNPPQTPAQRRVKGVAFFLILFQLIIFLSDLLSDVWLYTATYTFYSDVPSTGCLLRNIPKDGTEGKVNTQFQ